MPDTLTPQQRSLRAQIAVHESWANTADRSARTAPAREAFMSKFVEEARQRHPGEDDQTISRAADDLKKAHFKRMAFNREKARKA